MNKLYYENQYIKEFKTEILDIKEKDGKYHIVLEETAFFPGGGGQPADVGTIDVHQVIDVYEENGVVYHVVDKKPIKIHRVNCKIDWNKRFDGMQQHLGQHVLSGCFFNLFNANTVGFHLGKDVSTVDIEGFLDEATIREVEKAANGIIHDNLDVKFFTPTKSELKKMKLRRVLPKTNEEIRIVNIVDLDINACCGVHPSSTLELQLIKIKKWEKHKGATRIEFLAGKRAVENYFDKDKFSTEICRYLNCGEQDAINTIKNLTQRLKDVIEDHKKIVCELGEYKIKDMLNEGESLKDITIIRRVYENSDMKNISKIANRIVETGKVIVLFAIKGDEKANLVFTCSKDIKNISMNELLKDAISLIDGKGGGNNFSAQGGGKNNSNVESAIEYAYMKIKNTIK